jgi:hypothetical protein
MGLQTHAEFIADRHLQLVDDGDREGIEVTSKAVREVFAVEQFDPSTGHGLTIGEQLALLLDYYNYMEDQKKSFEHWQSSLQKSEDSTSDESNETTTHSSSDSGSTDTDSTSDVPMPSESESTQPSETP